MLKAKYLTLIGLFLVKLVSAQAPKTDSVVLTFNGFYEQVLQNHPLAKRAILMPKIAQQELRTARGSFDPVLQATVLGKKNKDLNIYEYIEPQLKIPTLIGLDLKAGMEQSNGLLINPERAKFDPNTGQVNNVNYQLFYGGASLPLLRGLFTDVRRTQLNLAKIFVNLTEAEQVKELNKLFLNAAKEYWNWQQAYERYAIMKTNLALAETRLNIVVNRVLSGEEKPIDSVEAIIEYQRRDAMLAEAELFFLNQSIELSNFLWTNDEVPLLLANSVVPSRVGSEQVVLTSDSLASLINYAQENHPEITSLNLKVSQLSVERKLAIENIKPLLTIDYYPFQTYTNGNSDNLSGIFTKNYKYGLTFSSSLFLRKERGKLGSTNYKLKQSNYNLMQGRRELVNNVYETYNELINYQRLYVIQEKLVANYVLLRDAEQYRFVNGESSLFLVNQRERSLIESEAKLIEFRAKYTIAKYKLQWASGVKLFN